MEQMLIIIAVATSVGSIVIIDRVNFVPKNKYGALNLSFFNDWIHNTVFNSSLYIGVAVFNIKANVKAMVPEDAQDKEYRRMVFQTTVDARKLRETLKGSNVVNMVLEHLKPHFPVLPRFPILPGSRFQLVNFTINNTFIPAIVPEAKGCLILRGHAKFSENGPFVYVSSATFYGEYRHFP